MSTTPIDLSNDCLQLFFEVVDGKLYLARLSSRGVSWLDKTTPSGLFGLRVDGVSLDASALTFERVVDLPNDNGVRHACLYFSGPNVTIEAHVKVYQGSALVEMSPVIRNTGSQSVGVDRVDSLVLNLPPGAQELLYFTGNWGSEFEPHRSSISKGLLLESRSGRSSKGHHPWFALFDREEKVFSASVAWSGNWALRFEPLASGGSRLSGGLHDWSFFKNLLPGESMEGASVVLALGDDLDAVSQQYARVGRRHWYPRNDLAETQPVEWNHWWPYEDAEINETVFSRNVAKAEAMGFEVCTLDAGWFGPADAGTFWEHYRGDWHQVNVDRFPSGLRALADDVHARGMKFGIWCEIEGLGERAQVAVDHPEYVSLRDGQRTGCVCFGSPAVQEWSYQTLRRLISEWGADWIKLDYNLDQGAGCNRIDHGHQAGDGQYEHYRGYYRTLDRIRHDFPAVVLENCSSGGLRIDLGMLRRTDMTFLSDPDWPDHDLQIFWGASCMLAAERLLHWTYSHWRNLNPPPYQKFDPHDPALTRKKWDYYARISMLGLYGISQRLPDLPAWLAQRISEHNRIYQQHVRRFVREADLYRLTDQPLRSGEGERWCSFQYRLPDGTQHLLFVFRLPGAEAQRAIRLRDLDPERVYTIEGLEGEFTAKMTGRSLMETGLPVSGLDEEDSLLVRLS